MGRLDNLVMKINLEHKYLKIGVSKLADDRPALLMVRFDPSCYILNSVDDFRLMQSCIRVCSSCLVFPNTELEMFSQGILDFVISCGCIRYSEGKIIKGLEYLIEDFFQSIKAF